MKLISLILLIMLIVVNGDKERHEDGAMSSRIRSHRDDHSIDAQAIAGSRKEADAMGNLPVEEGKRRLTILAKRMDENKDGKISRDELTNWIEKSIKAVDEEEVDERMREVDIDEDGKITWEEYVKDTFPHDKPSELDADDRKLLSEDEKYFKAADLDGDSKLDRTEFAAFLIPENYPHMHHVLVELTTLEKDEDKDGAISLKEFLGEMYDNPHSEWHKVETERFHRSYDTNGDGKLTGDEITKWLIPDIPDTSIAETKHIFERADIDKDDYLSYEEVANQYELFHSSEATRQGEHLDDMRHEEL